MRATEFVNEDIYSGLITFYHKTNSVETIPKIREGGFRAGPRARYGRGIYGIWS